MNPTILGIHHVTAITADAQRNIDFYTGVLGLRLVKLTVNFDDPSSYHLYYGDAAGSPGTILTYFAWPGAREGRKGAPQVTVTAFAAPRGSLEFWIERLKSRRVKVDQPSERFGQRFVGFTDPDGMRLEIVESDGGVGRAWAVPGIAAERALRGFHSITMAEEGYEHTARLLTDTMGFRRAGEDGNRFRFQIGTGATGAGGATLDVLCVPGGPRGTMGAGAVHHVAWRTPDDTQQLAWRQTLAAGGFNVSPVMDRTYFHSIYYREPGGVLFEIATDSPGFTFDEPAEQLGTKLMLPPWLASQRSEIERAVPPLKLPKFR